MTKKDSKDSKDSVVGFNAKESPSKINQLIPKTPNEQQQTLYQELKSSGSIDNPVKCTETHLEGGMED